MTTHLIRPEWKQTYCGKEPKDVDRVTSTVAITNCSQCYSTMLLVRAIENAEVQQFIDEGESE